MATEIERKFLVEEPPGPTELRGGVQIRQGYVAEEDGVSVRVRITDDVAAMLTIKAGAGVARTEVELSLDVAEAESLWPFTDGRRIEKRRHEIPLSGAVAELDVYAGPLDGLLTVEVEFADEDAAAAFTPPAWFGRELTGVAGWSNLELSRHGRPE